jgi:uncharacterized protein (TIGR00255 family)
MGCDTPACHHHFHFGARSLNKLLIAQIWLHFCHNLGKWLTAAGAAPPQALQGMNMRSMTGFASHTAICDLDGQRLELEWDMRAVNGRGLDLRLRLPETLGMIEKTVRDKIAAQVARGNVTLSLKLRQSGAGAVAPVDQVALDGVLAALDQVNTTAQAQGVLLQAPTALDLLAWRGVLAQGQDFATIDPAVMGAAVLAHLDPVLAAFDDMRVQEGTALAQVLTAQLDQIVALTHAARAMLPARAQAMADHLARAVAQVLDTTRADPARLEQELAVQLVKTDVTEELDRLDAHCASARAMLDSAAPIGRKLDFLMQEFNREANTLCSKAQHLELTRIGLDLKTVIDQMREQVQNLE